MSFLKSIIFFGSRVSNINKISITRTHFPQSLGNVSQFSSSVNSLLGFNRINIGTSLSSLVPMLTARSPTIDQTRSVTKWSLNKGKRKSSKAVTERFFRLEWGAWIRPIVGRHKKHWSKTAKRKIRGARHVFCNSTQSTLLDKMVTKYWRKPHYYVDDIYRPYHQREEFMKTAVKPR